MHIGISLYNFLHPIVVYLYILDYIIQKDFIEVPLCNGLYVFQQNLFSYFSILFNLQCICYLQSNIISGMHVLYMYTTYIIQHITYTTCVAIKKFDQKYGLRNTPNKMPIPGIAKTVLLPVHSNLDIANKSVRPFLFTISNNSLYLM